MTERLRWVGVGGLLALLVVAPYLGLPVHLQSLLYVLFFWVTLATSWNMLSGYSGYFSFGHGAFFGVGMYGMATFATRFEWPLWASLLASGVAASCLALGIGAVVFDRSPIGFEGPWATTARMETLRSPKQLTGPALGLPALTFRAWFEAQFGTEAWEVLDKIPRLQWMDYLRWYRHVLQIDVRNEHHVKAIHPRKDGAVELVIDVPGQLTQRVYARRVVLATGRDGLGGPTVPDFASRLPRRWWAHSSDEMDYGTLAGKRVGVIGAGASAMDSAATALEAGAASVDLLIRRADLPRVNKGKGAGSPGLVHGHLHLPDAWKWRIRHYINVEQVPPPRGSTLRVSRHANARFNFGCAILGMDEHDGVLHVATPKGVFHLDFLIFSTGFRTDWASRPEFSALAPHIRQWRDQIGRAHV